MVLPFLQCYAAQYLVIQKEIAPCRFHFSTQTFYLALLVLDGLGTAALERFMSFRKTKGGADLTSETAHALSAGQKSLYTLMTTGHTCMLLQ